VACTQLALEKSVKCRKLTRRSQATKNEVKQSKIDTSSFVLRRARVNSVHHNSYCAIIHYIMTKL